MDTSFPNVRSMLVPDPGYTLFDVDLSSADLRIVVWESNCRLMKEWFAAGFDPYTMVAREYYHDQSIGKQDDRRQSFKSLCHATNYLGVAKNIASNANIGLSISEVERIQRWYFNLFPEIKLWQQQLIEQVRHTHTVTNAFGYRRTFFDRIDQNTYNEAAAWIPQSTVGIVINHALVRIDATLPDVNLLLQVHDSLAGQYPTSMPHLKREILKASEVVIPYPDPLVIPVGIKCSEVSWGDCK